MIRSPQLSALLGIVVKEEGRERVDERECKGEGENEGGRLEYREGCKVVRIVELREIERKKGRKKGGIR